MATATIAPQETLTYTVSGMSPARQRWLWMNALMKKRGLKFAGPSRAQIEVRDGKVKILSVKSAEIVPIDQPVSKVVTRAPAAVTHKDVVNVTDIVGRSVERAVRSVVDKAINWLVGMAGKAVRWFFGLFGIRA